MSSVNKTALVFSISSAMLCGCIVHPPPAPLPQGPAQYVPEGEVVNGKASEMTMYDLETATQELLTKMRKSNLFAQNYATVKTASGGKLPVIVVGNIENRTSDRIQGRLDTVREIINTSLFEMDIFEVKDDTAASQIAARMLQSQTGGLENGSLVSSIGTHDSPDFMLIGDLSAFKDYGGYHTYKLHLAIHNLKTGKVVWQGIQTKIKL